MLLFLIVLFPGFSCSLVSVLSQCNLIITCPVRRGFILWLWWTHVRWTRGLDVALLLLSVSLERCRRWLIMRFVLPSLPQQLASWPEEYSSLADCRACADKHTHTHTVMVACHSQGQTHTYTQRFAASKTHNLLCSPFLRIHVSLPKLTQGHRYRHSRHGLTNCNICRQEWNVA